jgi:tetratricopeptide (TPR) repeat protein
MAILSYRLNAACAGLLLLAGCSSLAPQTSALLESLPAGLPARVELAAVPFFPQEEYQCGPAALATLLVNAGVDTTPQALVPQVYLPARKGSLQVEMLAAARRHGLVSYQLAPSFADLMRELAAGTPVIVLQNLGLSEGWHYAVAVGYDYASGELILRSGTTERETMAFSVHEFAWRRSGYWAMVALPPGRIPATADESRWPAAVAAFERAAIGAANAHHARGELDDAERMLRAALRAAPDSVIVLNNLAQTLSDLGRDAEALPMAERALAAGGPHAAAVRETRDAILKKIEKKN